MILKSFNIIQIVALVLLVNACTFNNEEAYFSEYKCDTTQVLYSDLTYIFSDICASCHHSSYTESEGIVFDSYEMVKASIGTGKVVPAIKHEGSFKMPEGRNKLSDCEIEQIEVWIEAGMPEFASK